MDIYERINAAKEGAGLEPVKPTKPTGDTDIYERISRAKQAQGKLGPSHVLSPKVDVSKPKEPKEAFPFKPLEFIKHRMSDPEHLLFPNLREKHPKFHSILQHTTDPLFAGLIAPYESFGRPFVGGLWKTAEEQGLEHVIKNPLRFASFIQEAPSKMYSDILGIEDKSTFIDPTLALPVVGHVSAIQKVAKHFLQPKEQKGEEERLLEEFMPTVVKDPKEAWRAEERAPILYRIGGAVVVDPLNVLFVPGVGSVVKGGVKKIPLIGEGLASLTPFERKIKLIAEHQTPLNSLVDAAELGIKAAMPQKDALKSGKNLLRFLKEPTAESQAVVRTTSALDYLSRHFNHIIDTAQNNFAGVKRSLEVLSDYTNPQSFFKGAADTMMTAEGQRVHHLVTKGVKEIAEKAAKELDFLPSVAEKAMGVLEAGGVKARGVTFGEVLRMRETGALKHIDEDGLKVIDTYIRYGGSDPVMFLVDKMADVSSQMAKNAAEIAGVKQASRLEEMVGVMKSVQGILFLSTNPTYLRNNFFNNVFTILAYGLTPMFGWGNKERAIRIIAGELNYLPSPAGMGFAPIGAASDPAALALKEAERAGVVAGKIMEPVGSVINKIRRGEEVSSLRKLQGEISRLSDSKLFVPGYLARKAEQSGSFNAWTSSFMNFWHRVWKVGNGIDIPLDVENIMRKSGSWDDFIRMVESAPDLRSLKKAIDRGHDFDTVPAMIDALEITDSAKQILYSLLPHKKMIEAAKAPSLELRAKAIKEMVTDIANDSSEFYKVSRKRILEGDKAKAESGGLAGAISVLFEIEDSLSTFFARQRAYTGGLSSIRDDSVRIALGSEYRGMAELNSTRLQELGKLFPALKGTETKYKKIVDKMWKAWAEASSTGDHQKIEKIWHGYKSERNAYWYKLYDDLLGVVRKKYQANPDAIKALDDFLEVMKAFHEADASLMRNFTKKEGAVKDAIMAKRTVNAQQYHVNIVNRLRHLLETIPSEKDSFLIAGEINNQVIAAMYSAFANSSQGSRLMAKVKTAGRSPDDIAVEQARRLSSAAIKHINELLGENGLPSINAIQDIVSASSSGNAQRYRDVVVKFFDKHKSVTDIQAAIPLSFRLDFSNPTPSILDLNSQMVFNALEGLTEYAKSPLPFKHRIDWNKAKEAGVTGDEISKVLEWINTGLSSNMAETKLAAMAQAKFHRNTALLNYADRSGLQWALSWVFPYAFWGTTTAYNWARRFMAAPQELAAYVKMRQKLYETEYGPEFPARLRGMLRVPTNFMPEEFRRQYGDNMYVDPLSSTGLPFEQYIMPIRFLDYGARKDILERRLLAASNRGASEEELAEIMHNMDGAPDYDIEWLDAIASPHLGISALWNLFEGEPIEPIFPLSRLVKQLTGAVSGGKGIDIEGDIRRMLNDRFDINAMPGDIWETYTIERAISNMVATGDIGVDEGRRAIIEREGSIWERAMGMARTEQAVKLALPGRQGLFPVGEQIQRQLGLDMSQMWENEDVSAARQWYEDNPEYAARQDIFRLPGERYKRYLQDKIFEAIGGSSLEYKRLFDMYPEEMEMLVQNRKDMETSQVARLADALGIELPKIGQPEPWMDYKLPPGRFDPDTRLPFFEEVEEKFRYAPDSVVSMYQEMQDGRVNDRIKLLERIYMGYRDRKMYSDADAFIDDNPELRDYWEVKNNFLDDHPEYVDWLTNNPEEREKWITERLTNRYFKLSSLMARRLQASFSNEISRVYKKEATPEDLAALLSAAGSDLSKYAYMVDIPEVEKLEDHPKEYDEIYENHRNDLRRRFGEDIATKSSKYFDIRDRLGNQAARDYLRDNPEVGQYWDFNKGFEQRYPAIARLYGK